MRIDDTRRIPPKIRYDSGQKRQQELSAYNEKRKKTCMCIVTVCIFMDGLDSNGKIPHGMLKGSDSDA